MRTTHIVGEPDEPAGVSLRGARELAAVVRLQNARRPDEREYFEQREGDGIGALGCECPTNMKLDAVVLIIKEKLERAVRAALKVNQVDLTASAEPASQYRLVAYDHLFARPATHT